MLWFQSQKPILHHFILTIYSTFTTSLNWLKYLFNNKHKTFISSIIFSTSNNISSFTRMASTWFICPFTTFVFLTLIKRHFYLWLNNSFCILMLVMKLVKQKKINLYCPNILIVIKYIFIKLKDFGLSSPPLYNTIISMKYK